MSRLRRADKLIPVIDDPVYLFNLSQCVEFTELSVSVKSQMRRAVRIYHDYLENEGQNVNEKTQKQIDSLSLFALSEFQCTCF